MPDTQVYGTMCTDVGNAVIANAVLTGTKIDFTQIVVGDGNGKPYTPEPSQTQLRHQVWSGGIGEASEDPTQANRILLHAVIPSSVGGWTMREIGVQDSQGRLIAVGNTPEIPKEAVTSGAIMEMDLYVYLAVVNADGVNIVVDPTVVIATKADINKLQEQIDDMETSSITSIKLGSDTIQAQKDTIEIPAATSETNGYMTTAQAKQLADAVPQSRKVNGHALSDNVTLTAADIGARPSDWNPDLSGYVPKGRKINGHALSADVTISPSDLTQDATHRFVSDTEKSDWNAKTQVKFFSVTVPLSGWNDAAPYTQTITVDGLTDGDAHLYLSPATAGQPTEDEETAFACITGGTTAANSLTLYCRDDKPASDITVRLEVIS